jgi:hypothetical protein
MNNESNIDKKVKYGFKPDMIGRERQNLIVNINRGVAKKINHTAPITTNSNEISNYIRQPEIDKLDNVFVISLHNSANMIIKNTQYSIKFYQVNWKLL